ncbi:MAG: hypothetical protein RIC52_18090 [Amphiplicatus sp.]
MTLPYSVNPMPHSLAVSCPGCGTEATFEFAETAAIARTEDRAFFQRSALFDYGEGRDSSGTFRAFAVFYHGLHSMAELEREKLPEGFSADHWRRPATPLRPPDQTAGAVVCRSCGLRRKHKLNWPADAFFKIEYKGKELWAHDREAAHELKDYVAGAARDRADSKRRAFLMKIPAHFLAKRAREEVTRQLEKALS